jgi:hypothetical protein
MGILNKLADAAELRWYDGTIFSRQKSFIILVIGAVMREIKDYAT